jgi:hypothetical protein
VIVISCVKSDFLCKYNFPCITDVTLQESRDAVLHVAKVTSGANHLIAKNNFLCKYNFPCIPDVTLQESRDAVLHVAKVTSGANHLIADGKDALSTLARTTNSANSTLNIVNAAAAASLLTFDKVTPDVHMWENYYFLFICGKLLFT